MRKGKITRKQETFTNHSDRMKYIETEIERRRIQDAQLSNPNFFSSNLNQQNDSSDSDSRNRVYPAPLTSTKISEKRIGKWPVRPDFRGATLGKLQEIDLGAEHTKKNIERTEELKRRLERGESLAIEPEVDNLKRKKRNRRRRNSLDIERDKLVEEVLKESRCMPPSLLFL